MAFKFERFNEPNSSFDAKVTLRGTGQFGFNAGAINRFRLKDFSYCVLYFDPDLKVVGIELSNDGKLDGAIEIRKGFSNTFIRAKNFCDRFGIDYRIMKRFDLKRDDDSGFLIFSVQQPEAMPSEKIHDDVESESNPAESG